MPAFANHPNLATPHGYHHAAVAHLPLVLTSGQTWQSAPTASAEAAADLAEETRLAVGNAVTALIGAGSAPESLLGLDVFVVGLDEESTGQVYRGIGRAARDHGFGAVMTTVLGVSALAVPQARVEVKATGETAAPRE